MVGYADKKVAVQGRLRRIEGQIRGLQRMVDEEAYCIDVLTQISAATKALQERPEATPALRDATRSPNPEVAKRAAEILEYFDRRPIRELNLAIKEGRIDRGERGRVPGHGRKAE